MKFASWDHFGVDYRRFVALALLVGCGAGACVLLVAGGVFGAEGPAVGALAAVALLYFVLALPRRLLETASLREAREATTLAASASAVFAATRSRCRTVLTLGSNEPGISAAIRSMKRQLLLGASPEDAFAEVEAGLASDSARRALQAIVTLRAELVEDGGEESEGLARSAELGDESKLPIFMSAAFFSPVMLILLAILTHQTDPRSLLELVGGEVVLLDIAFYFSSAERRRLA